MGVTKLNSAEKERYQDAIPKHTDAINLLSKAGESTEALRSLGMCYEGLGDCTNNEEYLSKAVAIHSDLLGKLISGWPFKTDCERKALGLRISRLVQSKTVKKPILNGK